MSQVIPILLCLSLSGNSQESRDEMQSRIAELEKRVRITEMQIELLMELVIGELPEKDGRDRLDAALKRLSKKMEERCAENLKALWMKHNIHATRYGGREKRKSDNIGEAFWTILAENNNPLVVDPGEFLCPFSDWLPSVNVTTYRGPATSVNKLSSDDIVGCCKPGLHPNGSIAVLFVNGKTEIAKKDTPLYQKALNATVPLKMDPSKIRECSLIIRGLSIAINGYRLRRKEYPPSGNASLVNALKETGVIGKEDSPYTILNGQLVDPWNQPFIYSNGSSPLPGWSPRSEAFDLYSIGPNGKDEQGSGDDIGNWQR